MNSYFNPVFKPVLRLISGSLQKCFPDYTLSMDKSVFYDDKAVLYVCTANNTKKSFGVFSLLKDKNNTYIDIRSDYPIHLLKHMYKSIWDKDSNIDFNYVKSIVDKFYQLAVNFKQFESITYSDLTLDLDTLTHYYRHKSQSKNKQIANFFYSLRSQKEDCIKNRKDISKAAKYSSSMARLVIGIKEGELVPLLSISIPVLSNSKFFFSIDLNKGLSKDEISLLLFKYESCLRRQLFQIIKRNMKVKSDIDLGDIKMFTLQQLLDQVLISEMINY